MPSASFLLDPVATEVPAEQALRRVSAVFLGLAVVAAVLAALYGSHYVLLALHIRLPEVSGTAHTLAYGYGAAALLSLGWAWGLGHLLRVGNPQALEDRLRSIAGAPRPAWTGWGAAGVVALLYAGIRFAASETIRPAELDALAAGEATLPFQYRVLVPWLAQGVAEGAAALGLGGTFPYRLAYTFVEAAAAFGAYAAFRFWLGAFEPLRSGRDLTALVLFVPLLFTFALPHRYNPFFFPWDTPSVAFFTLGLALLYRRNWGLYYPLFVLATLNRETSCFLAVALLFLYAGRERPLKLAAHIAVQAAIWAGIKYGLFVLYADNPLLARGPGLFVSQVDRSLHLVLSLPAYVYLLLAMGGLWVPVLLLLRYVGDRRVVRTLAVVPVFLLGMFFVGELLEIRIYGELVPIVTLAALLIGRNLLRAWQAERPFAALAPLER